MERRGYNPMKDKEERLRRRKLDEATQAEARAKQEQEQTLLFELIKRRPPTEGDEPSVPRPGYIPPFFRRNG